MPMHADEVDLDVDLVAGLLDAQFPQWRDRPIRRVISHGTVNALFRLGADLVARFPLQLTAASRAEVAAEIDNARRLAPHVPVAVPEPVALGEPGPGYDGPWSVWRWIDGLDANTAPLGPAFATDLAACVRAVHAIDTGGRRWPGAGRGGPLADHDEQVQRWLDDARELIDTGPIAVAWSRCLAVPAHRGADVWLHADLMPGNLIVRDRRLAAVLDLGEAKLGDPAVDLMPAWNLLAGRDRESYRRTLDVDDATWERGRGWAILQGIGALAYYVGTNPVMAETGRRTLIAASRR